MLASKFLSAATRRGVLQSRNMGGHAQTVVAAPLMSPAEISGMLYRIAGSKAGSTLKSSSHRS